MCERSRLQQRFVGGLLHTHRHGIAVVLEEEQQRQLVERGEVHCLVCRTLM